MAGIAPATRSRAAPQALVLDALCLILDILAPKLRPVSASSRVQSGGVAAGGGGPWPCSAGVGPGHAPRPCPQVSTQLYSSREKQQLASLVGTMLAYSLTYRQERLPDGHYVYRLEP